MTSTKRAAFVWLVFGLLAGLVLAIVMAGTPAKADNHITGVEKVVSDPIEANFVPGQGSSETTVWFRGSGFAPGIDIALLIEDSQGALFDISIPGASASDGGGSVAPLVANEQGAWATQWRIGRFTRNDVGIEGIFTVWVMDNATGDFLTSTPLALCNNTERPAEEEVPNFCSA